MKNRAFKFLLRLYKDESGLFGIDDALLIGAGSALLGGFSNKGEEVEEIYDPYAELRGKYKNYLTGKLGTSTPYKTNPDFNLVKPETTKAAESTILGKLGNLPSSETYKAQVDAAKTQDIAREKESTQTQLEDERNMYNKLGLVSSTPFLNRAGEIGKESLMRQGDISSKYDMYGLDYNLKADALADDIASRWASLGGESGNQDIASQKYTQQASESDIKRMTEEELAYTQTINSLLGSNAPERTVTTQGDDWMSLLSSILGSSSGSKGVSSILSKFS